jgi:hypothetical protein
MVGSVDQVLDLLFDVDGDHTRWGTSGSLSASPIRDSSQINLKDHMACQLA